jgi:hypothetical protein
MAMIINMAMIVNMAAIPLMPALKHNRTPDRSAEFERLLAEIFSRAGWRLDRQPKITDGQPDLVAQRGGKRYVFELKVSSEGRKDRAIPLISQAILEAQLAARRFPGAVIPVAVLAVDHISDSAAEQVKRFAIKNAPNVGIGIIDAGGFRSFAGHGLESLNTERSASPRIDLLAKRPSSANLFSDLNQWMLKILLSETIPQSMLSAPRGSYENASQLAAAAGVSTMSAFRFVRQLAEEGFLEDKNALKLVRVEELLRRWLAANQRRVREIPVRWILRGEENQLHVAVGSYLSKLEARSSRPRRTHAGALPKAPPRMCLGLFAAADVFSFGFVSGAPPDLYLERLDPDALCDLGLSVENSDHQADVHVRIPENPESVFRAAIEQDGVPVSDILQVWLDVSNHPARGKAQADEIYKRVLSGLFKKGRT